MDSQIALTRDVTLTLPPRLLEVIQADQAIAAPPESVELPTDAGQAFWAQWGNHAVGTAASALQLADALLQRRQAEKAVLYLGVYAERKAHTFLSEGKPHEALALLGDALDLEHQVLAHCQLDVTGALTDLLARTSERALQAGSLLGSLQALATAANDVANIFEIAATVWEPELEAPLRELGGMLPALTTMAKGDTAEKRRQAGQLSLNLTTFRKSLALKARPSNVHTRRTLLREAADAWQQMLHQEILLAANAEYSATALDAQTIAQQADQLIRQVERRLRGLIAKKYSAQYGAGWVQHIEAKHKPMYERWMRYRDKEQTAFKFYAQYSPQILDYSLFEDLADLIMAQWQLFREIFDFGYAERNKPAFLEKVKHIIQVRNLLAHNRAAPENELLRAKVLCTDILLALDQAGEEVGE